MGDQNGGEGFFLKSTTFFPEARYATFHDGRGAHNDEGTPTIDAVVLEFKSLSVIYDDLAPNNTEYNPRLPWISRDAAPEPAFPDMAKTLEDFPQPHAPPSRPPRTTHAGSHDPHFHDRETPTLPRGTRDHDDDDDDDDDGRGPETHRHATAPPLSPIPSEDAPPKKRPHVDPHINDGTPTWRDIQHNNRRFLHASHIIRAPSNFISMAASAWSTALWSPEITIQGDTETEDEHEGLTATVPVNTLIIEAARANLTLHFTQPPLTLSESTTPEVASMNPRTAQHAQAHSEIKTRATYRTELLKLAATRFRTGSPWQPLMLRVNMGVFVSPNIEVAPSAFERAVTDLEDRVSVKFLHIITHYRKYATSIFSHLATLLGKLRTYHASLDISHPTAGQLKGTREHAAAADDYQAKIKHAAALFIVRPPPSFTNETPSPHPPCHKQMTRDAKQVRYLLTNPWETLARHIHTTITKTLNNP